MPVHKVRPWLAVSADMYTAEEAELIARAIEVFQDSAELGKPPEDGK